VRWASIARWGGGRAPIARLRLRILLVSSLLLSPATAQEAARRSTQVSWDAPSECPDRHALVAQIEDLLGQSLDEAREQQLRIQTMVVRGPSAYEATLSVASAQEIRTRTLANADCARLTEAAALIIALAIDPERVEMRARQQPKPAQTGDLAPEALTMPSSTQTASPPPAGPPNAQPPCAPAPKRPTPKQEEKTKIGYRASIAALVESGRFPDVGKGVGMWIGLRVDRLTWLLEGDQWAASSAFLPNHPGAEVDLQLVSAASLLCWAPWRNAEQFSACVGGELGDMSGQGDHVENGRRQHGRWSGLLAELKVEQPIYGPLVLFAGLGGGLGLERPGFGLVVDGTEQLVFRPAAYSVRFSLGIGVRGP
jgi:hypothetical protein